MQHLHHHHHHHHHRRRRRRRRRRHHHHDYKFAIGPHSEPVQSRSVFDKLFS
jgi:hypothetical protein